MTYYLIMKGALTCTLPFGFGVVAAAFPEDSLNFLLGFSSLTFPADLFPGDVDSGPCAI